MSEKTNKPTAKVEVRPETKATKFFSVRALRDGFRRGGRAWSKQAEIVNAADFTAEQLAQIQSEPLLVVTEASLAEAKAAAAALADATMDA